MKNKFRSPQFWIGLIGLVGLIVAQFMKFDQLLLENIVKLTSAVLLALGVFGKTDGELSPITKESLLEKLKSPIAVSAICALVYYCVEIAFGVDALTTAQNIGSLVIFVLFGGAVYNNPNSRGTL